MSREEQRHAIVAELEATADNLRKLVEKCEDMFEATPDHDSITGRERGAAADVLDGALRDVQNAAENIRTVKFS